MTTLQLNTRMSAFLDLIALSEGTSSSPWTKNDGYDIIVTGIDGPNRFDNYSTHPFALGRPAVCLRDGTFPLYSTASGRYQIILETWQRLARDNNFATFSPETQDRAACALLDKSGIQPDLAQSFFDQAIYKASRIWASLPGSIYNQPTHTMDWAMSNYLALLAGTKI